ncbi:MAG: glycosyl hydrolase 53 family protein [Coprobacillus sp.]|nr:glycosyl hydrolase 53 family protein [Coprobacillus sp.]
MKKSRLTLLGCLLCTLVLSACQVDVRVEGDVNANIDTNIDTDIDIDTDDNDTGEGGDTSGAGESGDDGSTKEDVPSELTLTLSASATEVTVGDSVEISYTTNIAGASVSFSSSDTSLATVANNGHVTTLTAGVVTITGVASLDGYTNATDSVVITINPVDTGSGGGDEPGGDEPGGNEPGEEPGEEPGTSDVTTYAVEITNGSSLTPLEIGETKTVSVSLLTYTNDEETGREDASASDVTLSSSVSGVISISGLEITALAAGETYLTATWTEKEVQSSGVLVTVNEDTSEPTPEPEPEIEISFLEDVYSVKVDDTVTVGVSVNPSDATVTYSSSDTGVATVNEYGVVSGVSVGSATLTATATLEGYVTGTASCAINVTAKDEPIIGAYAICGDLLNSHWNASPDAESEYYLPYTASSDKVWTTTITIANEDTENSDWNTYGGWAASFCIVEYGDDNETVVAGYSAVDAESSTGVIGGDEESDHIQVYWRNQYTLTIDLNDLTNPSITITCLSEYDSAYALYGYFTEASWEDTPLLDSNLALRYNSKDPSTQYWTVTVTTLESTETWLAGFRIVKYGDYSTDVGTYSNLAADSPINLGEGDSGNINLNWNTTYVITIDGTSGTLSISISEYSDEGDSGDSGDSGASETVTAEYALVGDFNDSSWKESPDKASNYYHYYSSADESTYTWQLTVTMAADTGQDYDPSFYVTPYGSWETVVGFYHLDSNSTGVKDSASKDGGVCVDWGYTYDIVIDLSDTSNFSILVTLVEEEVEDEIYTTDGYYVLSGNLSEATWSVNPGYDSDYALPYDSTNSNSKYWTRTITTCSEVSGTSAPSFRVLDYNTWNTVAKFEDFTIDPASTGVLSYYVGDDHNIGLDGWNTTYDITIDMRGSTWTILINYHNEGFEAGINGKAGGSSSSTEGEPLDLDSSYAMGMDTSSIVEVLNAGGTFYDDSGAKLNGIDDFMSYLASQGINYIRIRLWNDPYDENGNSYKGGGNDLTTDLVIAEAAVKAGMKICLDLHYSDFWAHHGQQYVPKAWSSLSDSDLISTAAAWTTATLQSFKDAGCTPSMVQVGNETNGNQICGLTGNSTSAINFFKNCCSAVRSFDSTIQIVIHYSDDQNLSTYKTYYNSLISGGCDFDVIGLSYYSYYHESMSSFRSTLSDLSSTYSSKKICIMEYSYGYTVDWQYVESSDTLDNQDGGVMQNQFWTTDAEAGGYEASVNGQTSYIYDVNQAVASLSNGIGSFYWEPAWLALNGTCWASSYSDSYYQANNQSNSGYNVCTWANQALFDYSGHPLTTLSIYNQMWGK